VNNLPLAGPVDHAKDRSVTWINIPDKLILSYFPNKISLCKNSVNPYAPFTGDSTNSVCAQEMT